MNKLEYIAKQLSRTKKKKYELYVTTRIIHLLNRDDLEFITQQYVSRPAPQNHGLVDLYFPQLFMYVEIDEPFHTKQKDKDLSREADIIESAGLKPEHIKITDDLVYVNRQIDQLCDRINAQIQELEEAGNWVPWDVESKYTEQFHKNRGYLSVKDGSSFRRSVDACNALGQNYKAIQQSWFKLRQYPNYVVWFPKFYENEEWNNSISDDRKVIRMLCKNPEKRESYYNKNLNSERNYILAFPRVIDSLGYRLYKFAGVFVFDKEASSIEGGIYFSRVETVFELTAK